MTPAQRKAEHAKILLNDPLLKEALCAMRKSCYDQIEISELADVDGREDLYRMLKACLALEAELKTYINRGKLDDMQAPQIEGFER